MINADKTKDLTSPEVTGFYLTILIYLVAQVFHSLVMVKKEKKIKIAYYLKVTVLLLFCASPDLAELFKRAN